MPDAYRNKLIVGLADDDAGQRVYAGTRHLTASAAAVPVGASTANVIVGSGTTSNIGFFGAAATGRVPSASVTDVTSLKTALQNYGLIGT